MSLAISVIICSHNPKVDYLTRALGALREQTLAKDHWELLLIDNASREGLSGRFDLSWHVHGLHVSEGELGLTRARLRGISEAAADLLIFVDDDNVLDPDYLEKALQISAEWPMLGTWGGQCVAEFETPPPDWTRRWWNWIAVKELSHDQWSNLTSGVDSGAMPYGAGMCVRHTVGLAYRDKVLRDAARAVLDRTGTKLLGGGDADICYSACELGLGNGLFVTLKLTHLIPSGRLEESYLLKLVESQTCSSMLLRHFQGLPVSRPSRSQRLLKWYQLLHVAERDRRFEQARERGAEAARLEFERLQRTTGVAPQTSGPRQPKKVAEF